jgi:heme exporter protein A
LRSLRLCGYSVMIEIQGLSKYYGRSSALRNLSLSVKQGEFVALFGRNGAGKSSLLRVLAGLAQPSAGAVRYHGLSGSQEKVRARRAIGYLSHLTSLYLDLTAIENLRFYGRLMDVGIDDEFLSRQIRRVGLAGRERDPVRNYSRGMQQRLAIARAFLHDPDILLLDEPFTGLDQSGVDLLKSFLQDAHSKGKTCIMAIHDAQLGYEMADRLVMLEKGAAALDVAKSSMSLAEFLQKYMTAAAGGDSNL